MRVCACVYVCEWRVWVCICRVGLPGFSEPELDPSAYATGKGTMKPHTDTDTHVLTHTHTRAESEESAGGQAQDDGKGPSGGAKKPKEPVCLSIS